MQPHPRTCTPTLAALPRAQAYGACEPGEDHAAVLGRIVQGLGLAAVTPRMLAHPDARVALRSVLRCVAVLRRHAGLAPDSGSSAVCQLCWSWLCCRCSSHLSKAPPPIVSKAPPLVVPSAPCSAWLPLSEAVLSMAAEHLPSPAAAAPERFARLLPPRERAVKGAALSRERAAELAASLDAVEAAVRGCDPSPDAPMVLYVSKMVAVPANALPRWAVQGPEGRAGRGTGVGV